MEGLGSSAVLRIACFLRALGGLLAVFGGEKYEFGVLLADFVHGRHV